MPSKPSLEQVRQTLQHLANNGGVHNPVRLSSGHQLKSDEPKVSWVTRTVKQLTSGEETASIHGQQKQKAVDLIREYSDKSLTDREITVGQALLLLQSPASDEEFLECVKLNQFELKTDLGKRLFESYLEQKIPKEAENSVDRLSDIDRLLAELPVGYEDSRAQADQWLTSQKIKLLGNTPACDKVIRDALSTPESRMGHSSDTEDSQRMKQGLPEYLKRVDMVASLPVSALETLQKKLDEKGLASSDPLYQSLLACTSSGQNREGHIKTIKESYQNYLSLFDQEKQKISKSMAEDKLKLEGFEKDKESMSIEDIQESLWVGYTRRGIEDNEKRHKVLEEWSDLMQAELNRLNQEAVRE